MIAWLSMRLFIGIGEKAFRDLLTSFFIRHRITLTLYFIGLDQPYEEL